MTARAVSSIGTHGATARSIQYSRWERLALSFSALADQSALFRGLLGDSASIIRIIEARERF